MGVESRGSTPSEVRRDRVRDLITDRGFVRVEELSRMFGVSAVTVRADLDALASSAGVRRIRGGAMSAGSLHERSFEQMLGARSDEKARIAEAAVAELESGMSVFLDVGTTAAAVARELLGRDDLRDLVVITNGLSIALALEPAVPRLQVVVTGGTLRPLQHSLVAPLVEPLLNRLRADVAFIGCNGVEASAGVTNVNLPETEVKKTMISSASRAVVVADSSKIGRVHLGHVADISEVDALITGADAPADALRRLQRAAGMRVVEV